MLTACTLKETACPKLATENGPSGRPVYKEGARAQLIMASSTMLNKGRIHLRSLPLAQTFPLESRGGPYIFRTSGLSTARPFRVLLGRRVLSI